MGNPLACLSAVGAVAFAFAPWLGLATPATAGDFNPVAGLTASTAASGQTTVRAKWTNEEERKLCYLGQMNVAWALLRYNVHNNTKLDRYDFDVARKLQQGDYKVGATSNGCSCDAAGGTYTRFKLIKGRITCTRHGPVPASYLPDEKKVARMLKDPCFRTQFNLSTAIFRWNEVDWHWAEKIRKLNSTAWKRLLAAGLLSKLPDDPGKGSKTSSHFVSQGLGKCHLHSVFSSWGGYCHLCQSNGIKCSVHGACPLP